MSLGNIYGVIEFLQVAVSSDTDFGSSSVQLVVQAALQSRLQGRAAFDSVVPERLLVFLPVLGFGDKLHNVGHPLGRRSESAQNLVDDTA